MTLLHPAETDRISWSARFGVEETRYIELGASLTHCGVASSFVLRAFLDFAADEGALPVSAPTLRIVASTMDETLRNLVRVQDALRTRLRQPPARRQRTVVARIETKELLMQYLVAGAARIHAARPPLARPTTTSPLALKLSPALLSLLAQMTPLGGSKAAVLGAAVQRQARNLGLETTTAIDAFGYPLSWTLYPHHELLDEVNSVDDVMMALVHAYRHLAPVTPTMESVTSSVPLLFELRQLRLRQVRTRPPAGADAL